jgi:hypothetical protein
MKKHEHPFILKIIDDFIDNSGHQCIVQKFYDQGDFAELLNKRNGRLFEEEEIT